MATICYPNQKFTFQQLRQVNPCLCDLTLENRLFLSITAGQIVNHSPTKTLFKDGDSFTVLSQPEDSKLVPLPKRSRPRKNKRLTVVDWLLRLLTAAVLIPVGLVVAFLGLVALVVALAVVSMIPLVGPILAIGILLVGGWFVGFILQCGLSGCKSSRA